MIRLSLSMLCLLLVTCSTERDRRPNILFVITDDQSWAHTSYAGDSTVRTPAFDRIAREGVYFDRAYVSAPTCTASRSAILAGQHFWRLDAAGVLWGDFDRSMLSYQLLLEEQGYHTGYTGKGWGPGRTELEPAGRPYNSHFHAETSRGISQLDYAANFRSFLEERSPGAPFSFWLSPFEPHRAYTEGAGVQSGIDADEIEVAPFLPDNSTIRQDLADYYHEIEWQDAALAELLHDLEEQNLLENTLIVVTSDNGMPFPRAKSTNYEYGVRVPLAIRWGSQIAPQGRREEIISLTDLAPTFLAAAGSVPSPKMTGRNLLPMLHAAAWEGEAETQESTFDYALTGFERHLADARPDNANYPVRAIHSQDYVYIRNFTPGRWPAGNPPHYRDIDATSPSRNEVLRNPQFLSLATRRRPAEELYYLPDDPWQFDNLSGQELHEAARQRLSSLLLDDLLRTEDPLLTQDIDYFSRFPYRGQLSASDQPLREER